MSKQRIAIIGAGISGLTLARELSAVADVAVFEKARGVGGRMSTRYAEPYYFDHGTQFFTARNDSFKQFLAPHIAAGLVADWTGKVITLAAGKKPTKRDWFEPHYVASPHMNSLCKYLAEGLNIRTSVEVAPLATKTAEGWALMDKDGAALGVFDVVLSTAPPVQTARLFAQHALPHEPFAEVKLLGCYTLMLGFAEPWKHAWMAAKIHDSPMEWLAVSSSKPGRNAKVTCLVAHSSNAWAEAHIDDDMNEAGAFLRAELEAATGIDTRGADYFNTHRWRYALVENAAQHNPYWNAATGLGTSGDWCHASRIEDAWLAAMELARRVRVAVTS